ncbi:MAG: hypothetical protein H0T42_20140 [Deltaproteobacteria bacterium]|nr:hypothetical protein [Deltaproteobacteria bacterium]
MQLGHLLLAHIDIPERLLGALVVLVLAILIVLISRGVRGSPTGLVARPGAPLCTCGVATKWKLPDNHWHCERCNVPVMRPLACATCKGPGRWLRESNAWGCDHCRVVLPAAAARM